MAHSIPLSPAADLESLLSQATTGMHGDAHRTPACCCGQQQCAYLEKNDEVLKGLEQDLQSAAQIGQVRGLRSPVLYSYQTCR